MLPTIHRPPHRTIALWAALAVVLGVLVLAAIFLLAPAAGASTGPVVVDVPQGATVTFTAGIVALLVGTVTPVLTGLVTRVGTSNSVKAAVSFVLVALLAVINQIATAPDHTFEVWGAVILFATTFVTHMATWIGIWQPVRAGGPNAPLAGLPARVLGVG